MADEKPNPRERVHMKHEQIDGIHETSRASFDKIHSKKGWHEVDATAAAVSEALGTEVTDLGALSREDLDTVATGLGIDPASAKNKGELVDLITQTQAAQAGQP